MSATLRPRTNAEFIGLTLGGVTLFLGIWYFIGQQIIVQYLAPGQLDVPGQFLHNAKNLHHQLFSTGIWA